MFLFTEVKSALQPGLPETLFALTNHKNKVSERKINGRQATGGEIAFGVYLNCSGPWPQLSQKNRSAAAVLRESCVFLCLARFSRSPIYKHGRLGCCAVSFFI